MKKIEVPTNDGAWGWFDVAWRVSSFAVFLTLLIYETFKSGSSIVSSDNLPLLLALAAIPFTIAYGRWSSGRIDRRFPDAGVFIDSQIVIVQTTDEVIRFPVAEAIVRVDKRRIKRTHAIEVQDAQAMPFTHKLYIDHGSESTEVPVTGLMPSQIVGFATKLQSTFAETRAQLLLPEPRPNELDA